MDSICIIHFPEWPCAGRIAIMKGLLALAVAMGIGRFAFTPILPMMQADAGLSVAQGGWLASANYLGYLVGALSIMGMRWSTASAVRIGLLVVGATTLAMALPLGTLAWMALRFAAGVASAWVLVSVSAHTPRDEGPLTFAGVGTGIAFAGLACLVLMAANANSAQAWQALGLSAFCGAAIVWNGFGREAAVDTSRAGVASAGAWTPETIRMVACYGIFGFGYIIPATFLPAMARDAVGDPAVFGWSWPVFGAAAALSTLAVAALRRAIDDRRIWILGHLVMAAGVVVPLAWPGLAGIVLAAVLVGGTFMVVTMTGMQEARRMAGIHARKVVATMTAAFAAGQIAGPLLVSGLAAHASGFSISLAASGILLAASAALLTIASPTETTRRTP
jgi:predicted MFS family arabinose efflux permease